MDTPKANIFIIDDNLVNLQLLKIILLNAGYQVHANTSGKLALLSAPANPPDLILLDIMMPEMDGYEVCQEFKTIEETKDTPIIFMSALNETADKVRGFQAGAVDFITKPFRFQELLVRVETHLALQQAKKGLAQQNEKLAHEIAERKQIELVLARHNRYQTVVVELQKTFLQFHAPQYMYNKIVTLLGETTQVSRVHLHELQSNQEGQSVAYLQAEWCAAGISTTVDQMKTIVYSEGDNYWLPSLSSGKPIIGNSLDVPEAVQLLLQTMGVMSFLAFPLLLKGKLLGMICFSDCNEYHHWGADELESLQVIATSITLYYEQRKAEAILQETHKNLAQRVSELAIINHIADLITRLTDIETIFQTVIEQVTHFVGASHASANLLDATKTALKIVTTYNVDDTSPNFKGTTIPLATNLADYQAVEARQTVLVHRNQTDMLDEASHALLQTQEVYWMLLVPLLAHDEVIGTLTFKTTDINHKFSQTEINFIETIANQTAGAIEMARLFAEAHQAKDIVERANVTLRQANLMLAQLATIDGLTQVANRHRFDEYLAEKWQALNHYPLSLIIADVDHFKLYNDHYGHPAGDYCLQEVAKAIQQAATRPQDLVARYGGEEFVVVLPETDLDGALTVAETIQMNIQRLQIRHAASLTKDYITLSIGIAVTPSDSLETLLARADHALYQAKAQGRNQIVISTEAVSPLIGAQK